LSNITITFLIVAGFVALFAVSAGLDAVAAGARQHPANRIMGRLFRSAALVSLVLLWTEAFADDLPCSAFRRNLNASWSALRPVTIQGPLGPVSIGRGRTFRRGAYYKGFYPATLLEQNCHRRPF
jgi:hypothetical protein